MRGMQAAEDALPSAALVAVTAVVWMCPPTLSPPQNQKYTLSFTSVHHSSSLSTGTLEVFANRNAPASNCVPHHLIPY